MTQLKEKFGERLQLLRKQVGITQEELANLTGLSIDTISNIERGINGTKFDVLEQFAKILDVEVKDLFEFSE
jgi:transcriptional regulator with XRE-family HTH domain